MKLLTKSKEETTRILREIQKKKNKKLTKPVKDVVTGKILAK